MVETPHTYSDWTKVIRQFGAGSNDTEVILAMKSGTLEWQTGVADRFIKHLSGAVDKRIKAASSKFDSDLQHATDAEEGYVRALNCLNKAYASTIDGVNLPCVPEEYRMRLMAIVIEAANASQQSLEDSASVIDRTGRILSIVRSHAVNRF